MAIVKDTDFSSYKEQLRQYLSKQERFKDYNFEGSNMSILLDVLAYNTYQNSFYSSMSINEMFIDSAVLENSVLSHAKSLNYTPRSTISSAAKISFKLSVSDGSPLVIIPKNTAFNSTTNGKSYSFYTNDSITIFPENGIYKSGCVDIYEGSIVKEKYFAKVDPSYVYRISNKDVDVSSLSVNVTDNNTEKKPYIFKDDLHESSPVDRLFYVQCTDGFYEIYFGQNLFGIQPEKDSIIEIEYRISHGSLANGVSSFNSADKIAGYSVSPITVISKSEGGAPRESINSIKFYAPRTYQVKDRAITETDYEIILKNKFPEIQAISVMGGEKLNPPQYGKVAIYVDTVGADGISENIKEKIINHIKKRTPLAIEPIVLSPEFMFLDVTSVVTYDSSKAESASNIARSVKKSFDRYNSSKLNNFGIALRYSDLISFIDNENDAIISNQTKIIPYIEKYPALGVKTTYTINFNNPLLPVSDYMLRGLKSQISSHPAIDPVKASREDAKPAVYTSSFTHNGKIVYVRDNGQGILQIVQNSKDRDIVIDADVGTVDYSTGLVKITVEPEAIQNVLKIYATCKNMDIFAPKNSVLSIRSQDVKIKVKI